MGSSGICSTRCNRKKESRWTLFGSIAPRFACTARGAGPLKKGPQSTGRGRKGLSTKIHVGLAPGMLKSACLSEGQRVDMKVFPRLWEEGNGEGISHVIADKGYD